jgi:hypothetical protein
MRKFNKRDLLIFIVCLLVGAALIGLGMAYVIQLKQRTLPGSQANTAVPVTVLFAGK